MYVMYKDTPVMWFDDAITGDIKVYEPNMLPIDLRGTLPRVAKQITELYSSKPELPTEVIKQIVLLSSRIREAIKDWLAGRTLTIDREHAKQILNAYGFDQAQDDVSRMKIALSCRGVSVLDSYWIKYSDNDTANWDTIDIRRNALTDVMVNVALRGSSLTIQNKKLLTPEFSTFGAYAKAWVRKPDGLYLYKTGKQGSYESRVEVLVSKLLDCLNVNHLEYTEEVYDGVGCCVCKCMANEQYDILPAMNLLTYCNRNNLNFNEYILKPPFEEDFLKMAQVDYVISNPDRHSQNWGYYAVGSKLGSLHPLYDHNNAFDVELMQNDDIRYAAWPGHTMLEAARYGFKKYPLHITAPIEKDWFMTERQLKSFIRKLRVLGVKFTQTSTLIL